MSNEKKVDETTCGGSTAGDVGGFQIPMGIRKRRKHVDEMLKQNPDIDEGHILTFFNRMPDDAAEKHGTSLDSGDYGTVADAVRHHVVRELIRQRVREVVRKKPGGGGYVLYSPNKGKKRPPKPVGHFPTKLAAKRAELARFPPRDQGKLTRMRKDIDKLTKDPKKNAEREKKAALAKGPKEALQLLQPVISMLVKESLFREERTGSEWDEMIGKLSDKALSGDKRFQKLQQNIEKKTQAVLEQSFAQVKKAVGKDVKLKSFGIKKSPEKGKTYLAFSASMSNVAVEPIYVYVENGVPKIEVSDQARVALTKADADQAKLFRAELVTLQERVLDKMDDLVEAIAARDKYLEKLEDDVDGFVTGLTPLQVSLLKVILTKKYRGTK